jgi:hypothetical protein
MVEGDGTRTSRGHLFYSISKRLVDDVQELALKCGWASTVSTVNRSNPAYDRPEYTASLAPSRCMQVNQKTNGQISDAWVPYEGKVYCCEVPGDGIILVRRNGRPVWSGNSKVASTYDIEAACRWWGLRATDVMQGPVYGLRHDGCVSPTALWYDDCFGTVLNRFCAQAVLEEPLTIYGTGEQVRAMLPLADSLQCLRLLLEHPPVAGEYRCVNQFDQTHSINELADMVEEARGCRLTRELLPNPRVEAAKHFYEPVCKILPALGYVPAWDLGGEVQYVMNEMDKHAGSMCRELLVPSTKWR